MWRDETQWKESRTPIFWRQGEIIVIDAIARVGTLVGHAIRRRGCLFQVEGVTAWLPFVSNAPGMPVVWVIVVVL